jgi:hypothetical protein
MELLHRGRINRNGSEGGISFFRYYFATTLLFLGETAQAIISLPTASSEFSDSESSQPTLIASSNELNVLLNRSRVDNRAGTVMVYDYQLSTGQKL